MKLQSTLVLLLIFLFYSQMNAQSWSELGGANSLAANNEMHAICSDVHGNIYAAGRFRNSSGNNYVAKYDGRTWSELGGLNGLGAGVDGFIYSLYSDTSGNIYAAGRFTNSSGNAYVAKFNGSTWSELGGPNGLAANNSINSICGDASGNIYAAGWFTNSSGKFYVAKYDGNSWSELEGLNGLAANNPIHSICSDVAGNIYAAGLFFNSSEKYYVAKYNGSSWSELGGLNGLAANRRIYTLCSDVHGNIYAGGEFFDSTRKPYVAKYDGSTWSSLRGGNGMDAPGEIYTLYSDSSGNIYAAGTIVIKVGYSVLCVTKYNGSSWSVLGGQICIESDSPINSICGDASGNIYAAGWFINEAGKGFVAKYGGATAVHETSIADIDVSLYPNPIIDELNIHSSKDKIDRIEIENMLGMTVNKQTVNDYYLMLPTTLTTGMYVVKIYAGDKIYCTKIMIEHH